MKKILATIVGMVAGASFVHAQAYLQLSSGVTFGVTTNTGVFGYPTVPDGYGGFSTVVSGKISSSSIDPLGYYFAFLYIPTGIGTSQDLNNLTDGNWVQLAQDISGTVGPALLGTNDAIAGNWQAQGGPSSTQVIGLNGDAFNNGTTYSVAIVGWSASLGSSWNQVSNEYSSGFETGYGFFGYEVGSVNPSSGVPGNTPPAIWGNNSLVLYSTPIPEPATFAFAGLGGLSLLFFRRRKN